MSTYSDHAPCPQILITRQDFHSEEIKQNLYETMSELIALNIVPIINTNDAVAPPPQIDEDLAGVSATSLSPRRQGCQLVRL